MTPFVVKIREDVDDLVHLPGRVFDVLIPMAEQGTQFRWLDGEQRKRAQRGDWDGLRFQTDLTLQDVELTILQSLGADADLVYIAELDEGPA